MNPQRVNIYDEVTNELIERGTLIEIINMSFYNEHTQSPHLNVFGIVVDDDGFLRKCHLNDLQVIK